MADKDAYWFPHDANARSDLKVLGLRDRYGWAGYGVWWALVEMLREAPDYALPIRESWQCAALARQFTDFPVDFREFIRALVEDFGLLQTDGVCIWSHSLRRRMHCWDERRERSSENARRAIYIRWERERARKQELEYVRITPVSTPVIPENYERNTKNSKKRTIRRGQDNGEEPNGSVPPPTNQPTPQAIVEEWNKICGDAMPKIARLTEGRRQKLRSRLAEAGRDLAWWETYFLRIRASPLCCGEVPGKDGGPPWRADFDWAIKSEEVMIRVLEGKYDRRQLPKPPGSDHGDWAGIRPRDGSQR